MLTRILIIILLTLGLSTAPCLAETPPPPGAKDRCPVCGMFVAPYTNWISVIQFKDGAKVYFDGPKDLFVYVRGLDKFRPGASTDDIAGVYVTDYYSTKLMKAEEVFFVTGSDVMGPMGIELVPVQGREQAETFLRDHAGKKLMRFDGGTLVEMSGMK